VEAEQLSNDGDGSNPYLRQCCKENLGEPEQLKEDLVVRRCKVCNRRHFELTAEPGKIFAKADEAPK
jgi:hypothetical protein